MSIVHMYTNKSSQQFFDFGDDSNPATEPPRVAIGCCGWSYNDWSGKIYPATAKPTTYISHYANQFRVVEVDSSFYGCPTKQTVESWKRRTPPDFGFALKMPRTITHEKLMRDCEDDVDEFVSAIERLGNKLRCVCMQFGFLNEKMFLDVSDFLLTLDSFLAAWNPDIPIAIEVRNPQWLQPDLLDCLRQYRAALVLVYQSGMPTPTEVMEQLDNVVTGQVAYIRLLGDRHGIERITQSWNEIVVDKSSELTEAAHAIQQLAKDVPVLAFVNNHYAGYAPASVAELEQLVADHTST